MTFESIEAGTMFNMKEARLAALRSKLGTRKSRTNTVRLGIKMAPADRTPTCQLSITPDVLARLHWQKGDKLNVMYNDDYCIVERDNKGYWSLSNDGGSKNFLVSFTPLAGKYTTVTKTRTRTETKFKISDDRLIVAW